MLTNTTTGVFDLANQSYDVIQRKQMRNENILI